MTHTSLLLALKNNNKAWFDSQSLEEVDLRSGVWESFHDPSVNFAVTLFQSLFDQWVDDVVWDQFTGVNALRNDSTNIWVMLDLMLEESTGRYVD